MTRISDKNLSNSRVDAAGSRLRAWWLTEIELSEDDLWELVQVVNAFRAAHQVPLTRLAAKLRYFVQEADSDSKPVQRLKRIGTIVDKLGRHQHMKLSRMQDVGGCRAILPNQGAVDHVVDRISGQKRWEIVKVHDYVRNPKADGYRAVHVICRQDRRLIEAQLRTPRQHTWAELIEGADRTHGYGLKAGRADADISEYYRLGALLLDSTESGKDVSATVLQRFRDLHKQVEDRRASDQ